MKPLNPTDADEIFESLVGGYDAVPPEEAGAFLARLCLLLGRAIGDPAVVRQAVRQARECHPTAIKTKELEV
jgi:hypothetical protein